MLRLVALAATLALVGCGEQDADPAVSGATDSASTTTTPTTIEQKPAPEVVRFRAADGRRIHGLLRTAGRETRAPGVVLVHQSDGGADQWDGFAPVLRRAGFITLAVDGDGGLFVPDLGREARGALNYLRARSDIDPRRLSVIGASIGGDTAVWAAATAPRHSVASVVALSPSGDSALLDRHDAHQPPARNVLFVSNRNEADGSSDLLAICAGCRRIEDRDGGHGIELLTRPSTRAAILAWLTDPTHVSPRHASR